MGASIGDNATLPGETWEQELLFRHRWGQHGDIAHEEHDRLKKFREAAGSLDQSCLAVVQQIIAIEICNWNLEESILALCAAIGAKTPTKTDIGHLVSITQDRWAQVWAYYLALRNWLPCEGKCGYEMMLNKCDADRKTRCHILGLLGDRNELKELYVERFCLCLEFWLGGFYSVESAQMKAHKAAVSAVEEEIKKRDPDVQILNAMKGDGDGNLQPCHHKAFRRYDIILSSIGAGKWRSAMPMRGTDGLERAATLEKFLAPIAMWIERGSQPTTGEDDELVKRIRDLLGEPDTVKRFLASLLVSLLRAQQLAAKKRAEKRQ
jgi:hypothetical protein